MSMPILALSKLSIALIAIGVIAIVAALIMKQKKA